MTTPSPEPPMRCDRCGFRADLHDEQARCPMIFDIMGVKGWVAEVQAAADYLGHRTGLLRELDRERRESGSE